MAAVLRVADLARNAQLNAIRDLIDAGAGPGLCRIYDGAQPADADDAIVAQVLLCEIALADPSAPNAAAGVLTFTPRTGASAGTAIADGTATWARILDSNGLPIFDANVGEAAATPSLVINSEDIVTGGPVEIQSLTLIAPAG